MYILYEEGILTFSADSIRALEDIEHAGDGVNLGLAFEKRKKWAIIPGWEEIKHSDNPNCRVEEREFKGTERFGRSDNYKSYYIYTIRDIKQSEEITIDFNTLPEELSDILKYIKDTNIEDDNIIGDEDNSISTEDILEFSDYLNEESNKLTTKERKKLPDKMFGLPKQRKYPLHDEAHVRKAIQFFTYCKEEDRKELAKNIKKRMRELNMDVNISEKNPLYKYINEQIEFDIDEYILQETNRSGLSNLRKMIFNRKKWKENKEKYIEQQKNNMGHKMQLQQQKFRDIIFNSIESFIKSDRYPLLQEICNKTKYKIVGDKFNTSDWEYGIEIELTKINRLYANKGTKIKASQEIVTVKGKPYMVIVTVERDKIIKIELVLEPIVVRDDSTLLFYRIPVVDNVNESNIEIISNYIKNDLSPEKVDKWNDMIKNISPGINKCNNTNIWNMIHNGLKIKDIEKSYINNSIQEIDLTIYTKNDEILNELSAEQFTKDDVIARFDLPYEGEGINLHIAFEKRKYWKIRKGWENVKHSDDPNCKVVKHEWLDNPKDRNKVISYFIVTIKDIKKGESITIDYNTLPPEIRNKLIQKNLNDLDFMDIFDIEYSSSVNEDSKESKNDIVPVYIVLTSTGSTMAKIIQKFTNTIYNHASLAFDVDLSRMYSFGVGDDDRLGFALESRINTYLRKYEDTKCQVYSVFVKKEQADKMRIKLDEFITMKDRFKYNFLGLIGYLFKKPIKKNYAMFCSEFVDSMFKLVNIDLTNKDSGLVEPYDFARSKSKRIFKLYEGPMKTYEPEKVKKAMMKVKNNYKPIDEGYNNLNEFVILYEVKEFPVQFDKEGNLLIKNFKKIDYEHEYAKSHKLLIAYEESNNYEGIKYELSKLWFMNSLLEKSIYDNKTNSDKKKEYIKVRARILNDFNKYLKLLSKIDKSFNFTEYYDNTPFSDAIIKINKDTITGVGKLIKNLIL